MMQDDTGIAERRRARHVKKAADDAAGLTIAERLTRRARAQTVKLAREDEGGEFIIEMRRPMRAEMEELQKMQLAIQKEDTQDEANERLCAVLGDLCLDESLTTSFWLEGNYSMSDLIEIVQKLFESLVEQVKAAQSFRNK